MAIDGQAIADFLGRGEETQLVTLAQTHIGIVTELVRAYTRGKGFNTAGEPNAELSSVITTATARLVVNPEQNKREQFGDFEQTPGTFYGWTVTELGALNRYRKRASSGLPNPPEPPLDVDGGSP